MVHFWTCDSIIDGKIGDRASLVWVSGSLDRESEVLDTALPRQAVPSKGSDRCRAQVVSRQVILLKLRLRGRPLRAGGSGQVHDRLSRALASPKGQHPVAPVTYTAGHPRKGVLGDAANTFLSLEDSSSRGSPSRRLFATGTSMRTWISGRRRLLVVSTTLHVQSGRRSRGNFAQEFERTTLQDTSPREYPTSW